MKMTDEEKEQRIDLIRGMFETAGVKASDDRVRSYCNETALLPLWMLSTSVSSCLREKSDGYQTAPQVGQLWDAAKKMIPSSQWQYRPGTGSLPPKWFRLLQQENNRRTRLGWGEPKQIPLNASAREAVVLVETAQGSPAAPQADLPGNRSPTRTEGTI